MSDTGSEFDPLGTKSIGKAIDKTVEAGLQLITKICEPGAEELGLWMREVIGEFRKRNVSKICQKTAAILEKDPERQGKKVHPRVLAEILEKGSWAEEKILQDMWSGLLFSSCNKDKYDDVNLIFVKILGELSSSEARLFNYIIKSSEKRIEEGYGQSRLYSVGCLVTLGDIKKYCPLDNYDDLDTYFGHFEMLNLINRGNYHLVNQWSFNVPNLSFDMYVRCNGYKMSPAEYFKEIEIDKSLF